jgi:translocation and assembly module TamB
MNRKKIIGRTLAGLVLLIAVGVVAGYFYLQSTGFREFAMRKIIEQVDESTGGRTQIRSFDFNLSTLTAHLYGVVIQGREAPGAPPLLRIDKLTVGLKIRSVLHRQISLRELLVERPVVHLQVDEHGNNNIPQPPPSNSTSNTDIFDLAVGRTAISDGEIDYNDRKIPLDADLHNLRTDVRFELLARQYRGSIAYDSGHLRYDKYTPLAHDLNASFTASPSLFKLDSASITVGASVIKLTADVTDFTNPAVQGNYDILLHSQDVAEFASGSDPAGEIAMQGTFHAANVKDRSLLRSLTIEGQLGSKAIAITISDGRLEARNLRGHYRIADGSLRANGIETQTLGGLIRATLDVDHLDSTPSSHVKANLQGISLNAAQRVFGRRELSPVTVSGALDGTTEISWVGPVSNAHARLDAVIRGTETGAAADSSAKNVSLSGSIHAAYDGPKGTLSLLQTTLRMPGTNLAADGQISNRSQLEVKVETSDLQRLVALVSAFRPAGAEVPLVSGSATMNATVQGSMRKPEISARLNARDLKVQGSEWKSVDMALKADPTQITVTSGSLTNVHQGHADFDAKIGLSDWSYLPASPIQAHLSLRQMQIADLQHLANVDYPVSGEVSANVSISGSQLDPRGSGSIDVLKARAYDEPLKTVSLKFHGDNGSVESQIHIAADAGAANATLTYTPKTKAYIVRLDAPAIVLQKLKAVQAKNLSIQGSVTVTASGQGTLDDPQLTASIRLPKLEVKEKSIMGVKADIHVANKRADLTLDSQIAEASVRGRGHVDLTGDYPVEASFDTAAIPLQALLATFSSQAPEGFSGQTELHATLKGPLKDKTRLEAHIVIPTLTATYQALQVGAAGPIRADYAHSVVTLQPAEIRGTGTSLRVQGSVPVGGTSAPNLTAQGSIDARIFRILSPDLRSSGVIAVDLRATGSTDGPQVSGQVRLQNVAFATPAAPLGIDKLNGVLDVGGERVQISSLTGEVGGGHISAGGSITYRPTPQFDIALQADTVRLRYPDGLRSVLDGNLTWVGNLDASTVNGRVLIGALSFTPDFDLATFGDQFSGNASAPAVPGFGDTISLQIAIQSKENLTATSSQISLEGSASLNATGTVANPIITGRTDLTSGELFYRNVRYELQRGIITLADPGETRPTLDVSVSTTIEQYNLTMNLRGPFDMLTTSYTSDPPLSTADIINLIARGKTSSELAASSQSTDSMIASQAASQFSGSVQKLAGISSLQIDPLFGGNNQNPSARLAVQQRVTKNFLFTFSTDVSQPGNEIVEGDYQINKRWSVSVSRGQVGGVSVDGRFHTKF